MTAYMPKAKGVQWGTPRSLVERLKLQWGNESFDFDVDVAASKEIHVCDFYFDEEKDGLSQDWWGVCFMNPPYGRCEYEWVKKATVEVDAFRADRVVSVLPAKVGGKWWHDFVVGPSRDGMICLRDNVRSVEFLRGRLAFESADSCLKTSAPFPSVVVVFEICRSIGTQRA